MSQEPYIRPNQKIAELTPKSILLGIFLSVVLAGANAYLGLFAGLTVSASIPAAVLSMALLKMLGRATILENNAVQTAASAGESLAAGVIFTIPALVLMGYWKEFNYWETTLIALCGGVLGVLFTVPLRSALIVKRKLKFPEGIATAEVLKTGDRGGEAMLSIIYAGLAGAVFKFADTGMGLWHGILDKATLLNGRTYLYFGMNLSPALMSVGYIVGLNIAVLVFAGGVISWWIAIPAWIAINGPLEGVNAVDMGYMIWSKHIRYLGVGAMAVGGLWTLLSLRDVIGSSVKQTLEAFQSSRKSKRAPARTEQDMSMKWVGIGVLGLIIPIFGIYMAELNNFPVSATMAIVMVLGGFLFSTVASYMAGLVGSSNNPVSGVTIATILTSAFLLLWMLGSESAQGPAAAIMIGAVVCCAAAIGGDNMQDLKSGHILGATPYKQQIMQMVGVIAAAFAISPVLTLLQKGYGFGAKSAAFPNALPAPQASLMQGVAEGVFGGNLPWNLIIIGALIGVATILLDEYLKEKKSEFRTPVLAVAIGVYLPFELGSAILLGGLISWAVGKQFSGRTTSSREKAVHTGTLIGSGLIAGEALVGILLAIPIAATGRNDVFRVIAQPLGNWPGVLALGGICYWVYRSSLKAGGK